MRHLIRLFLVAAVVVALVPPTPAWATTYETQIDYFTGCDTLTSAGDAYQDCNGSWSYTGTQAGDWMRVMKWNCNTGMPAGTFYYENCGGTWVVVDYSQFGHGCLC